MHHQPAPASDVAFSEAVKAVQQERGSRNIYARVEQNGGGFETTITEDLRAFLAKIDTAFLATASADGQPYVQHRGGPKGFLHAWGDEHIAFIDFAGNRQYISTGNLAENDRICLFLIDYESRHRIKIWGTARSLPLTDDLRKKLTHPNYRGRGEQVIEIKVTAWDVNCPQHIPQKLDARDVKEAWDVLQKRIDDLETENARLRALLGESGRQA